MNGLMCAINVHMLKNSVSYTKKNCYSDINAVCVGAHVRTKQNMQYGNAQIINFKLNGYACIKRIETNHKRV